MRYCASFLLFFMVMQPVDAQVRAGVKGGLNMANVALNQNSFGLKNQFRPAFHAGVYGVLPLGERLIIVSELLYSTKGYSSKSVSGSESTSVSLNYISNPTLLGYHLSKNASLLLGPEPAYLLTVASIDESRVLYNTDFWDNKFDLGIVLGCKYLIKDKIDIDIRYVHGLINVISGEVQLTDIQGNLIGTGDYTSKNRVFQLSLGYRLN